MYSNINRLIRFYIAGGINTLLSYCIFAALIYFGFVYWLAVVICYAIGLVINYKTIKMIAFNDSSKQSLRHFFFIFCITCLVNIASLKILIGLGVNTYLAPWIVVIPISLLSYFLNKKYVFNVKSKIKADHARV
jgi:putative flippase GtrA